MYKSDSQFQFPDYEVSDTNYPFITIGSNARNECKNPDERERLMIKLDEKCVYDIDEEGSITGEGRNLRDLKHPEEVLEAWTTDPEQAVILEEAKRILICEDYHNTKRKLLHHLRVTRRAIETPEYTLNGITTKQFNKSENIYEFLFAKNQHGPKYNYLRYIQIATLTAVVQVEKRKGRQFFTNNGEIQPTIINRLEYLESWDLISKSEKNKIARVYTLLSSSYQNYKNSNQTFNFPAIHLEECLSILEKVIQTLDQ